MAPRGRTAAGTLLWLVVLGGSLLAIGAGFAGGRTYGTSFLQPVRLVRPGPLVPAAPEARDLPRMLRGARSLDAADDDPDRYGDPDRAFAMRPPGWAPAAYDARRGHARIAVLLVDTDRAASALNAFAAEPYPVAVLIAPDVPSPALRIAREGGKTVLIACAGAPAAAIAALRHDGAAGIACSTGDDERASALIAANRHGLVVDDLLDGDALLHAARRAGVAAITRDVTADARDDAPYVDFLLEQSLAIAERTGVATVALHARPASHEALERFAVRARRDGVDLVGVGSLLTK